MAQPIIDFSVHNRHKLRVSEIKATLDVLTFTGEERLSQPFKYTIEFTCTEQDLAPAQILGRKAWFSLYGPPPKFPQMSPDWLTVIPEPPLRTVYGVVTGLKRLSDSRDEARYEIILQPRLALLDRGKQYRIYQKRSVPEIVESILLSLFVRKLGIKLIANQGTVSIQAQNDALELMARHSLQITSTEDEIHITAKKKIVINGGGSYITLEKTRIESGTAGDYNVKSAHFAYSGPASMTASHPEYPKSLSKQSLRINVSQAANAPGKGWARMPYTLYADGAPLQKGILDNTGQILIEHQVVTRQYRLQLANGVTYQIPIPTEYDNPEQGVLANGGLHNHRSQPDEGLSQPASHTDHRDLYAAVLQGLNDDQEDKP